MNRQPLKNKWHKFASLLLLSVLPTPSFADVVSSAEFPHLKIVLSADQEKSDSSAIVPVSIQFALEPGWHIYGQSPGDVGLPTEVKWELPEGAKALPFNWPTPLEFQRDGLRSFGYEDKLELVVPIDLRSVSTDQITRVEKLAAGAMLSWAICKDECIPGEVKLAVDLPATVITAAVAAKGETISASAAPAEKKDGFSFPVVLLFAFIGGLILNLMPCVFPILALKVLGFAEHGGEQGAWKHGLVYSLGVLLSFWALAGVLLFLRYTGNQLGWGFQFQSPLFVCCMAIFLFVLGLNLAGVFEWGGKVQRIAGSVGQHSQGYSASFLNGALATLLSTPCSAPFMGSAVAAALTMSALHSMAVFTSLALGLSAPYLLLSFLPALTKYLPRPGEWMVTFKQFMSFPIFATSVWLLSVLVSQLGPSAMNAVLFGEILITFGLWFSQGPRVSSKRKALRTLQLAVSVFAVIGGLIVALPLGDSNALEVDSAHLAKKGGIAWERYSDKRLEELKQSKTPVLVTLTAAWCMTCQVNHRVAFDNKDVIEEVKVRNVVSLLGDWTNRDPEITHVLERFDRGGVPLTLLFRPNEEPIVFSPLLTPGDMLRELKKVS